MHVHQVHLCDRRRTDEFGLVVKVRAGLHAATASHATRQRINLFLLHPRHPRSRSQVSRCIDRHPCLDFFQVIKHFLPVNNQIAHDRKLVQWRQSNRLLDLVDQTGTGLTRLAVDHHRAGAADFLQAVAVPDHRFGCFAFFSDRVLLHFHQGGNHVHPQRPGNDEFFGIRGGVRRILPLHNQMNGLLLFAHLISPPLRPGQRRVSWCCPRHSDGPAAGSAMCRPGHN